MIIIGVLAFSIVVIVISYRIGKSGNIERGKLATYITLLMWASFLWGLFIMWTSR
jgi:hypothetical protein